MLLLKPKDLAKTLDTPPDKVSLFAQEIEQACLYTFHRTPLGSYLFEEKDIRIIKEYQDMLVFFQRKKEALAMLQQEMKYLLEDEQESSYPWTRYLHNAKNVP